MYALNVAALLAVFGVLRRTVVQLVRWRCCCTSRSSRRASFGSKGPNGRGTATRRAATSRRFRCATQGPYLLAWLTAWALERDRSMSRRVCCLRRRGPRRSTTRTSACRRSLGTPRRSSSARASRWRPRGRGCPRARPGCWGWRPLFGRRVRTDAGCAPARCRTPPSALRTRRTSSAATPGRKCPATLGLHVIVYVTFVGALASAVDFCAVG